MKIKIHFFLGIRIDVATMCGTFSFLQRECSDTKWDLSVDSLLLMVRYCMNINLAIPELNYSLYVV